METILKPMSQKIRGLELPFGDIISGCRKQNRFTV